MIATLHAMTSGECRWVGRHDIHVYCFAPLGRPAVFTIVTVEATTEPMDATSAVRHINALLAQESAHVA